uniref:Tyrosine-protein kinase ephrin type A/B receptor-like domain-containing protein n=1 Tax=Octopus bimaculoides TaxID=37653 RepID=A0A0L8FGT2_OCTBM|eukprot:XP_014789970.1 PREDICTED: sushi, von Willebrand factor type A, EGF and pentraxin domain-containing protein 1-like [Octopus bimaculoides]
MSSDSKCLPCPRGYFKEQSGNAACTKCPQEDRTTPKEGTVYSTDCTLVLCKPGHYLNSNEEKCYPCPVGSYKTTHNRDITCESCPKDRSTPTTGSQSVTDCSIVTCKAGSYLSSTGCKECAKSYYQPQPKMTECIRCSEGKTTYETGATSGLQCLHICPQGESMNYTKTLCTQCLSGYYGDRQISQFCVKCPTGKTTIGTGQESLSKCIKIPDTMAPGESASVTLYMNFKFYLPHCTTQRSQQLYEHLITDLVRDNLITLGKTWLGLCTNKCKSLQTYVKCFSTNTTQTNAQNIKVPIDVTVKITDVKYNLFNIKDNITVLAASVIGQHCLKLSSYTLIEQNIIPVCACTVTLSCYCVDGQIPIQGKYKCGNNCRPCPRGTYHNTSISQCQSCPKDHYQDQTGSIKCKSCPSSLRTERKGARSKDDCSGK